MCGIVIGGEVEYALIISLCAVIVSPLLVDVGTLKECVDVFGVEVDNFCVIE